ncbi:hypothetical protein [Microbispora sp. NBRC 16548]|uniref:hypothetical protein n=1 Tax=Microbispora sp. NBRC 16548 TaxID=3030994 RepID=UPI0024A0F84C|nr:hypothetical protein [Microbispora sp. NBRC 16548]GLX09275.1 hypothetical protein Misp03_62010 [Microbispora sp. NBRC 16548]
MAFLQHASGSANTPKGVTAADGALTANLWVGITTVGLVPPMDLLRDPLNWRQPASRRRHRAPAHPSGPDLPGHRRPS